MSINNYKKISMFIFLFAFNSIANSARGTSPNNNSMEIVNAMLMVELTIQGAMSELDIVLEGSKDQGKVAVCFEKQLKVSLKDFFSKILIDSLDSNSLSNGAVLTRDKYINNVKGFVRTPDFVQEAIRNGKRVDSYIFYKAAKTSDTTEEKKTLIAFANWIEKNGPKYSVELNKQSSEIVNLMSSALESCVIV